MEYCNKMVAAGIDEKVNGIICRAVKSKDNGCECCDSIIEGMRERIYKMGVMNMIGSVFGFSDEII